MKILLLVGLCISTALCQFQLTRQSYTTFPSTSGGTPSLFSNAAHQASYDPQERILYVLGAQLAINRPRLLHIVDMFNPAAPSILLTHSIDPSLYGRANDVQVCGDTVAVSLDSPVPTKEGYVIMFTTFRRGNTQLVSVGVEPVGVDPKGMAFTTDCQKLVIANEGRGGLDESFIDPPGSVSILLRNDLGSPAHVNINFQSFLENREAAYQAQGVRWVYRGDHTAGIVNNMWDDLEPDQVTISMDQRFAYVSLPENNAIARIDINAYSVNEIFGLGLKNWTLFRTDTSDQDGGANLNHYPIYAMYQPTDIATAILNGQEYIVSANQGVIKRYAAADGLTNSFDESKRARQISLDGDFDTATWPATLTTAVNSNQQLGRLLVRESDGRDPISQRIKDVTAYGARSASLWQVQTMSLAYDTADELETKENEMYPNTFNGECSNGNQSPIQQRDLRSDDHGPEPTALAVGMSGTTPLIVIGTRTGALHLYSDDLLVPRHQSVHREGQNTQTWNSLYTANQAGDAIITDIGIINADVSPNGRVLVWAIGSATGSLGVYEVSFLRK